jgi:hypothetical protein
MVKTDSFQVAKICQVFRKPFFKKKSSAPETSDSVFGDMAINKKD